MASEVFNIDIDLSALQQALKVSEQIKNNLSGISKNKKSNFTDSIKQSNKELKKQNTLLKTSYKTLQLIRMTMKGIAGGLLGLGALGISGFANATRNSRRYKSIGINERQGYSLDFASEMAGLDRDSLTNAAQKLQEALRDVDKYSDLATLGFSGKDIDNLKKQNPVDALIEVMKKTGEHSFFGTLSEKILKESFDNAIGGFEEFRTLLGDNTNEIKKYYGEGMRIYKDNYKNLKQGDQALIRLKNQFNRFRLMLATKIEPAFSKILEKLKPLLEKGSDAIGKAVGRGVDWLFEINKETGNTNLDQLFINLKTFAKYMNDVIQPVKAIVEFWNGVKTTFETIKNVFKNISSYFSELENAYNKGGWKELLSAFKGTGKYSKGGLTATGYNNIGYKGTSASELFFYAGLGDEGSKRELKRRYENGELSEKDRKAALNYIKVNDAVITKDGQVIKTSPQDYIFATKKPQAMAGGNYTININANVRNDNDIQKIKYELNKLIKSFNV